MNPRNTTPGFPKRVKIRRNPLKRRNNRPVSLRRLRVSRLRSQGSVRARKGGATGACPKARANWRIPLPSRARSMTGDGPSSRLPSRFSGLRPSGGRGPVPARARTRWRLGHPRQPRESWRPSRRASARPVGGRSFSAPVPSGRALATAPSIGAASGLVRATRSRCNCSKTRSRAPFPGQRFIRMWMVRQLPNRLGSPRRFQPCSATCGMALSACGFGARTLPRCTGRCGAMRSH